MDGWIDRQTVRQSDIRIAGRAGGRSRQAGGQKYIYYDREMDEYIDGWMH